ncbi:MAG TPA: class I SAM-dependent methyltransferase, partial [Gemmatimonadaceae bacterium]|nr:class I SAM-dependent methyltransferase [Gemmatimonadaceae bacterium]
MKVSALQYLRCPDCAGVLTAHGAEGTTITTGHLECANGHRHQVRAGIARFVPADNYATTFGFQWNLFRETQLDRHSGHPISADRFWKSTGWTPGQLAGKRVLDIGCGAGRFTDVALGAGAEVVALDYSSAVDACAANHAGSDRLTVVQGDIYHLPVLAGAFDFVYCLGVLQHTPDVHRAFRSLRAPLRSGGRLAVDVYGKSILTLFTGKYWVRPLTARIERDRLFSLVRKYVPVFLPVSVALGRVPMLGRKLRSIVPISNYDGILPL